VLALALALAALVPAACRPAPPFHPGPLGAVAYLRGESLHVLDVSSRRDRVVAHVWIPGYEGIAWSGDGRWLSVGTDLVPAAGGPLCRPFAAKTGLYGDDPVLRWSPKGELLTATTAKGVFLYRPGGVPRRILPPGWSADGFSPGGSRVAAEGPNGSLYVYWNTDGSLTPWHKALIDGPGSTTSPPARCAIESTKSPTPAWLRPPIARS